MLDKSSHGDSIWRGMGLLEEQMTVRELSSVACKVAPSGRDGLGD